MGGPERPDEMVLQQMGTLPLAIPDNGLRARYGVDPTDEGAGIRVFFDDMGYLHIDNCRCPDLELFLEDRMSGWYRWAREEYRRKQGCPSMNDLEMIEPHTKVLKDGFYQTRYRDEVFNFNEEIRFALSETYLPFDHSYPGYFVCTGFPRLDEILMNLINDDDSVFPAIPHNSGSFQHHRIRTQRVINSAIGGAIPIRTPCSWRL